MVFDRVVCGVDGSAVSETAVRAALRLASGEITLLAVIDGWDVLLSGPDAQETPRQQADAALDRAVAIAGDRPVTAKLMEGGPRQELRREAERVDASAIVVGSHGRGRVTGAVMGSVASGVVHDAPCSVLVVREGGGAGTFPETVLVGVDGSPTSAAAFAAARSVCDGSGAALRVIVADDGSEDDAVAAIVGDHPVERAPGSAVIALIDAPGDRDLVVVGSRGLHGIRAIGSVSERVAHMAPCSVLVVRGDG